MIVPADSTCIGGPRTCADISVQMRDFARRISSLGPSFAAYSELSRCTMHTKFGDGTRCSAAGWKRSSVGAGTSAASKCSARTWRKQTAYVRGTDAASGENRIGTGTGTGTGSALVEVASESQPAARVVEVEYADVVGVLVGHDQKLPCSAAPATLLR